MYESYHQTFWLILNGFKINWIILIFILGILNHFKCWGIRIILRNILRFSRFFFYGLNRLSHLTNWFTQLNLVEKITLALILYIYSLSHNSQNIESFASILSRSQKLIVHKFFKIKHFFLESLCTLSHIHLLRCV